MCGIYGFNWEGRALLRDMARILHHRGPNGSGEYIDEGISLGHRRLSIIDLSAAGKQPMCNEDGTVWITYNGEVYNFQELRKELEKKGHTFASHTDTEVIIHGYEEWGELIVEKLNGMFAFALWDEKTKTLFLARDRTGVKPLYYYWNGEKFIFASEIKAILLDPTVPRQINHAAVSQYLNLRYIPGEETIFSGIKSIPPGYVLTLRGKKISKKQYWDLPIIKKYRPGEPREIRERLQKAVAMRLVADVPVGIYLSGGIDSAAITALASRVKDEPVKTFSVGFEDNHVVDELPKAQQIARHCQTDHTEIHVKEGIAQILPKLLWHLDQPHGDPVIIPQFYLSQQAGKRVKVVLSGEGADESFGGYVQYKTMLQARKISWIPKGVLPLGAAATPVALLDKFFDYPSSIGAKGKEKVIDFLRHLSSEERAYRDLISILSDKDRKNIRRVTADAKPLEGSKKSQSQQSCGVQEKKQLLLFGTESDCFLVSDPFLGNEKWNTRKPLLARMMYHDLKTWLPNYVLFINDRMTMANSIEGRTPFLDYTLLEHVNQIDPLQKMKYGRTKVILRAAMKPLLPREIINGKKHAFFMPLDKWYKEELKGLAEQLFTPTSVRERGYFNYNYIKNIWEKYPQSPLLYGKQLFTLINFELWQRMFIDPEKIATRPAENLSSLV